MAIRARAEITLAGVSDGAKGDKGDTGATGAAGADGKMIYGTCSTAATTAAKVATATGFKLVSGTSVSIKFTYANTAASPTLNINSLGAKAVYTNGARYAYWAAGSTVTFVYDGTNFQVSSVPVYASTATIGNPGGGNVYVDGSSVNIRKETNILASFTSVNGTTFVKGYQNLMLCAGTADEPKSVYFTIPPTADGTESDFGMGLVVDGSSKHAYIASSDGVGNVIDWVVAKGTSDDWSYRKWASGIGECWLKIQYTANGNKNWGTNLNSALNYVDSKDYPFTFSDFPNVSCTCQSPTMQMMTSTKGCSKSKSPLVQAISAAGLAFSESTTIVTTIRAIGKISS